MVGNWKTRRGRVVLYGRTTVGQGDGSVGPHREIACAVVRKACISHRATEPRIWSYLEPFLLFYALIWPHLFSGGDQGMGDVARNKASTQHCASILRPKFSRATLATKHGLCGR